MGQASRGSPRSGDSWPLEQPRDEVWEWSSKGVGWGEEAPVREFGSLHPAPLFSFQTTTDRYMDTWENSLINPCYKENGLMACTTCLDKIHLEACMHSFDLHCVLRKTHIRDVMPWTGVEIQNLGLDQIRVRALSLSLSLIVSRKTTVERIASISKKYLHLFCKKRDVVISKGRTQSLRKPTLKSLRKFLTTPIPSLYNKCSFDKSICK